MKSNASKKLIKGLAGLALVGVVAGCTVHLNSEPKFQSTPLTQDRSSSFHGAYDAMVGDWNWKTGTFANTAEHGVRIGKIDFDHVIHKGGPSSSVEIMERLNNITIASVEHTIEAMGMSQIQQNPQAFAENVRKQIESNFSEDVSSMSVGTLALSKICFDNGLNECLNLVSTRKSISDQRETIMQSTPASKFEM